MTTIGCWTEVRPGIAPELFGPLYLLQSQEPFDDLVFYIEIHLMRPQFPDDFLSFILPSVKFHHFADVLVFNRWDVVVKSVHILFSNRAMLCLFI